MKNTRKVLKPAVRHFLIAVELALVMIIVSTNDFNLEGFIIWISMIAMFFAIGEFLETYSPTERKRTVKAKARREVR